MCPNLDSEIENRFFFPHPFIDDGNVIVVQPNLGNARGICKCERWQCVDAIVTQIESSYIGGQWRWYSGESTAGTIYK